MGRSGERVGERGCRRLEVQRDDGIGGVCSFCVTNTGRPSSGLVCVHGVVGLLLHQRN